MSLLSRLSSSSDSNAEKKCSKELVIVNRLGMHARPSARFVKVSNRFKSDIWVEKDGEQVNGKSIMGLMMLAAGQGSKLRVTAEGPDAEKALQDLETLVQGRFDEE
jgi:phosphocarrier protein HPr